MFIGYPGIKKHFFCRKEGRNKEYAMMMRAAGVTVLSLALTTIVIANAYYQKKQFYPSVVYITKSNPSMAVSGNGNVLIKIKLIGCFSRLFIYKHLYVFS